MILVYTGPGKGKTSACLGQAVRALGRGLNVGFAQFMKQDNEAGEQDFLRPLLGDNFLAGGAGFFTDEAQRPEHRQAARRTLDWALAKMPELDVLILDEILYALGNKLVLDQELEALLEENKKTNCHLILSGRGFPEEFIPKVDLVTEMQEIKHPWHSGQHAVPGLDY